jgi:hypothetical protein
MTEAVNTFSQYCLSLGTVDKMYTSVASCEYVAYMVLIRHGEDIIRAAVDTLMSRWQEHTDSQMEIWILNLSDDKDHMNCSGK